MKVRRCPSAAGTTESGNVSHTFVLPAPALYNMTEAVRTALAGAALYIPANRKFI